MAGVGPRASKEEFIHALGLEPSIHESLYKAMRDEAIVVYNQMNSDRSNLLDERRNDGSVRPPFYWHHIRPERQRWGIIEIWRNKSDMTRQMFDRGITNGEYGPNWVTHWLLYSVFRSRDVRNNRNRRKGDDDHSSGGDQRGSQSSAARTTSSYYDPARNGYH